MYIFIHILYPHTSTYVLTAVGLGVGTRSQGGFETKRFYYIYTHTHTHSRSLVACTIYSPPQWG